MTFRSESGRNLLREKKRTSLNVKRKKLTLKKILATYIANKGFISIYMSNLSSIYLCIYVYMYLFIYCV